MATATPDWSHGHNVRLWQAFQVRSAVPGYFAIRFHVTRDQVLTSLNFAAKSTQALPKRFAVE